MKKDILRYFIDYCKDSTNTFNLDLFRNLIDMGVIITNDNDVFELPDDNIYVLSGTNRFTAFNEVVGWEELTERATDNGFNTNLTQLQTLLGDDYMILNTVGLVELVTGDSKYINYPELFDVFVGETNELPIIWAGIIISYDSETNAIILASVETWLKYRETVNIEIAQGLEYSIFGELGGGAVPA